MPDGRILLSVATISLQGERLRYDGENVDTSAKAAGFFRGSLISLDGTLLTFQYSNRDSSTSYFAEGLAAPRGRPGGVQADGRGAGPERLMTCSTNAGALRQLGSAFSSPVTSL